MLLQRRTQKIVIHLAAGLKGAPAELFVDSVVTARNLLESLGARGEPSITKTRVVLVSSFGVYGVVPLGRGARVDESTPLEQFPERRDPYSHSKLRQEQLVREYQQKLGFELVVLRPGVIYGPGGGAFSNRVGIQVGPIFVHMGGSNPLPLSYVVNCAEAIVVAATHPDAAGQVYNVHDDEMPTAARVPSRVQEVCEENAIGSAAVFRNEISRGQVGRLSSALAGTVAGDHYALQSGSCVGWKHIQQCKTARAGMATAGFNAGWNDADI